MRKTILLIAFMAGSYFASGQAVAKKGSHYVNLNTYKIVTIVIPQSMGNAYVDFGQKGPLGWVLSENGRKLKGHKRTAIVINYMESNGWQLIDTSKNHSILNGDLKELTFKHGQSNKN